jgi:hypothetical protein
MTVSNSNILMGSFTGGTSAIAYYQSNISQVWYGATQIWGATSSGTWLTHPGNFVLVSYTPASNQTLVSMSMTYNTTQAYNYCWGVWTASGSVATPVSGFVGVNSTTGISFTNDGTLGSDTKYIHTKTWGEGSRLSLVAGTTYLMGLGERYQSGRKILGTGTTTTWEVYEWSLSTTSSPSNVTTNSTVLAVLTLVVV